jgi:hypothetical protein
MTASSSSLVQLHPDYGDAEANHDVFKLVAIAKETHLDNLEEEAMRLETKLQTMRLGSGDFPTYSSDFRNVLVALQSTGSEITARRIVRIFLLSLKGSVIQGAADWWLDDPTQSGFPRDFESARTLMHRAWVNHSTEVSGPTIEVSYIARWTEDCWSYQIVRERGEPNESLFRARRL